MQISSSIFKAYDIRGIVDQTLSEDAVLHIGRAFGIAARAKGVSEVVIGRDGRLSGLRFSQLLARGLRDQGVAVIDIGMVATPIDRKSVV